MSRIILKEIISKDVSLDYVNWMNDSEIVRFTDQKNLIHTKNKIKKFVNEKKKSKSEFLYGIFFIKNKKKIHIGNIKLGPINFLHSNAQISYIIGKKEFQRRGIGSLAIKKVLQIAKRKFKLRKIIASIYPKNIGSRKVLLKNQFLLEGKLRKMQYFENKREDLLLFGKII